MNIVIQPTESASSTWRQAFADTLIRLQPELNPDAADELSDSAFQHLADLDAEDAAALYTRGGNLLAPSSRDGIGRASLP